MFRSVKTISSIGNMLLWGDRALSEVVMSAHAQYSLWEVMDLRSSEGLGDIVPIRTMDCPFHELDHLLQLREQKERKCGPVVCMYSTERNSCIDVSPPARFKVL